jgi:hypothetical protein
MGITSGYVDFEVLDRRETPARKIGPSEVQETKKSLPNRCYLAQLA